MMSIDYCLSTHATFPAAVEDVKTGVRWLRAHAALYALDPKRIGFWGSYAGGHLALWLPCPVRPCSNRPPPKILINQEKCKQ